MKLGFRSLNMIITMKKELEKEPRWDLLEAIIEIRFESSFPPDAILGVVYKEFIEKYSGPTNLPILQIPEAVRLMDPNLKYKPYFQFSDENFSLELGPKVLIIRNQPYIKGNDYVRWEKFSEEIGNIFKTITVSGVIDKIERIGIRYVNFFDGLDVFKKVKIKVSTPDFKTNDMFLVMGTDKDGFESKIQISNKSEININSTIKAGSIIDIDTYCENPEFSFEETPDKITEGHDITEKLLFEKILTQEYVDATNR